MLYYFAKTYGHIYPALEALKSISIRATGALFCSFFISLIAGRKFLQFSRQYLTTQPRVPNLENHALKGKTPNMGGLFIMFTVAMSSLIWNDITNPYVLILIATIGGFGIIGGADDISKIRGYGGISALTKFSFQIICASIIVGLWTLFCPTSHAIIIPLMKYHLMLPRFLIGCWSVFIIVGTSNAVNLTDGLDGLVTGPLIMNFAAFATISYLAGHAAFARYLAIPFVGTGELPICSASIIGALLGFLWYNVHPAQIFMGDIGSLSLGAGLGFIAIASKQELLLPVIGGIFVLETVSVILQITSLKFLGKRMFKMAPIHHHFELKGWSETTITLRFWIISLLLCLMGMLALKL